MLWSKSESFDIHPFESESEFEKAIIECSESLFGPNRVYVDVKKKIGLKGKTQNIPDGYLIDLASTTEPRLYVVENELASHDPLKHIAVQILEFSLSFETSPHGVKNIVKSSLSTNPHAMKQCQEYAVANNLENVDVLLERLVHGPDRFRAMVIMDDLSEELEQVLINRFKFPVEILTLERYCSPDGKHMYRFDPFLVDVVPLPVGRGSKAVEPALDPSAIDTIVVPARDDGFQDVFLGQNRWYAIRIHSSMIPKIKYVAGYRVAPESAITHIATVKSIEQWRGTNKYVVSFAGSAEPIGPIRLKSDGIVKAPQGPRYTSRERLLKASTMDDAF
jgi:hypothetical protein